MISSIFIHDTNEGERRMKAEVANILTKIGAAAIVGAIKAVTDAKEASKEGLGSVEIEGSDDDAPKTEKTGVYIKKQFTKAFVFNATSTMLGIAKTQQESGSSIHAGRFGFVKHITGFVQGLAQQAVKVAEHASTSAITYRDKRGKEFNASTQALQEAQSAVVMAGKFKTMAEHFFIGDVKNPWGRGVDDQFAATPGRSSSSNLWSSGSPFVRRGQPQPVLADVPERPATQPLQRVTKALMTYNNKQPRTDYGFFGFRPEDEKPILPGRAASFSSKPVPASDKPQDPRKRPTPVIPTNRNSNATDPRKPKEGHTKKTAAPKIVGTKAMHIDNGDMPKDPRQRPHNFKDPKLNPKDPRLRGRGLIHVPNPVMPYNDISNDHFLNKYPTQQYI